VPDEPSYLDRIRALPCHVCASPVQVQAHHSTCGSVKPWELDGAAQHAPRGKGQKAHDSWAFPLCFKHHRQFHDAAGHFEGWPNAQRRDWQNAAVAEYRGAYLDTEAF
jgi:hypothetical protein